MAEQLASIKEQVYIDPRPAGTFTKAHERVRVGRPSLIHELARFVTAVPGFLLYRMWPKGARHVWRPGATIIAPNHFSNFDHFIAGWFTWHRIHFMAKSQMFANRFLIWFFSSGGTFPVQRGRGDEESMITARTLLQRGRAVVMYCEGGRSRSGKLAEVPKRGIGRLALQSGARVVPCAIYGSERIRNWRRFDFPKITVEYGTPLRFTVVANPTRAEEEWAAKVIHDRIKALYIGLEVQHQHRPSH